MVYRYPAQALWSSPQGKWKWDTEYVLEASIAAGQFAARLLAADATTVVAASPAVPLTPEEVGRRGMTGFQTWRGTGQFREIAAGTAAAPAVGAAATTPAPAGLGPDWQVAAGEWTVAPDTSWLRQTGNAPVATAVTRGCQGARGEFRCRVTPRGAKAVALLFQVSADSQTGFECRLGNGLQLRDLAGKTLWEEPGFAWTAGSEYVLEGIVKTDRVQVRVTAPDGKRLVESVDRYVSDANNDRRGSIGFRTEAGAAEFAQWQFRAEGAE